MGNLSRVNRLHGQFEFSITLRSNSFLKHSYTMGTIHISSTFLGSSDWRTFGLYQNKLVGRYWRIHWNLSGSKPSHSLWFGCNCNQILQVVHEKGHSLLWRQLYYQCISIISHKFHLFWNIDVLHTYVVNSFIEFFGLCEKSPINYVAVPLRRSKRQGKSKNLTNVNTCR